MWRKGMLVLLLCFLLCSFSSGAMASEGTPDGATYSVSTSDMNRLLVIWQELENLNVKLQAKLNELQNNLNMSLAELETLKHELSVLRAELETLKNELLELRIRLENSQQDCKELTALLQKSEDSLANLEQSFSAYKAEMEALASKLRFQRNVAIAVAGVLLIICLFK